MDTGEIRVRLRRIVRVGVSWIWRGYEPPINDADIRVIWLQQFRRIPCHGVGSIGRGHDLDAIVHAGERANVSVILRNNIPRSHRGKIIIHDRRRVVRTLEDWLRNEQLHENLDDVWDTFEPD